eukprot:TRINITY_DN78315_c0_g1_i1.p1 TRINITY_DN78315_c0_g1~~TRINITY_DN78315_c0_g1_i1.p1  ORF type:complete len:154 (+),score=10.43 TRINITY_DN78315_c0_g1_i1:57-464(+)
MLSTDEENAINGFLAAGENAIDGLPAVGGCVPDSITFHLALVDLASSAAASSAFAMRLSVSANTHLTSPFFASSPDCFAAQRDLVPHFLLLLRISPRRMSLLRISTASSHVASLHIFLPQFAHLRTISTRVCSFS